MEYTAIRRTKTGLVCPSAPAARAALRYIADDTTSPIVKSSAKALLQYLATSDFQNETEDGYLKRTNLEGELT